MTTTELAKPIAATNAAAAHSVLETKVTTNSAVGLVTLDQLAHEMQMAPRDARMLLRLAAKQTKQYPTLGKEHVARQPWQWPTGSKALAEAKRAIAATHDPA